MPGRSRASPSSVVSQICSTSTDCGCCGDPSGTAQATTSRRISSSRLGALSSTTPTWSRSSTRQPLNPAPGGQPIHAGIPCGLRDDLKAFVITGCGPRDACPGGLKAELGPVKHCYGAYVMRFASIVHRGACRAVAVQQGQAIPLRGVTELGTHPVFAPTRSAA